MGEIEDAAQRLQAALDRLEQAIEARVATDADAEDDRPAVREALEATRAENAALQRVVETVATRLDATIDRLKAAGA
jgi:chromosome segregation ATPase